MTEPGIKIDGFRGEGGGQVLRTALALSVVTGKAFTIDGIRAGRSKPGLMRQHLSCVQAAADVGGDARLQGAHLGSTSLTFEPSPATHGDRTFAIGTAGATALLLQTVLPPLLVTPGRSRLVLEGGTHAAMAPTADFIVRAFAPVLRAMGASIEVSIEQHGFYPAGGGRIVVVVVGGTAWVALSLLDRGPLRSACARALIAHLPAHVGHREVLAVRTALPELSLGRDNVKVIEVHGHGPGNALLLDLEFEHSTELICAFGARQKSAEAVAAEVVADARIFLDAAVPVGAHLADQLLIPLALGARAGSGGGSFCTLALTAHTLTNIDVIRRFLDVDIRVHDDDGRVRVCVSRPSAF